MKRVAILGFGLEGKSLFSYLKKEEDFEITVLDRDPKIKIARGIKKVLGKSYLKNLGKFDLVFRSPGMPYNLPELKKASGRILSLTRLFFEEIKKKENIRVVGITGSAGKTTTATLLYKILKHAGRKVFLGGNIGKSPLDYLEKLDSGSTVVMELSSFQLQDLNYSPDVALVLDIFEEHLDKHKNFREYFDAKSNIARHQKKSDAIIYFADNKYSSAIAKKSIGKKIQVTLESAKKFGFKLKVPGDYNYKNAMAAGAAARLFGVKRETIIETVNNFKGIKHRLDFVRNLNGEGYYKNSKETNLDWTPLVRRLARRDIRSAVYFGVAAGELERICKLLGFSRYSKTAGLESAIKEAHKISIKGDITILSPGTASFDEFSNYEERGDKFRKWVLELK